MERQAKIGALAYKLDQVAQWDTWTEKLNVTFKYMTGPDSPHYFKVCSRGDLGHLPGPSCLDPTSELSEAATHDVPMPQRADDVVVVTKQFLSSRRPLQVLTIVPGSCLPRACPAGQPQGVTERRRREPALIKHFRCKLWSRFTHTAHTHYMAFRYVAAGCYNIGLSQFVHSAAVCF